MYWNAPLVSTSRRVPWRFRSTSSPTIPRVWDSVGEAVRKMLSVSPAPTERPSCVVSTRGARERPLTSPPATEAGAWAICAPAAAEKAAPTRIIRKRRSVDASGVVIACPIARIAGISVEAILAASAAERRLVENQALQLVLIDQCKRVQNRALWCHPGAHHENNLPGDRQQHPALARGEQRGGIDDDQPPRTARAEPGEHLAHARAGEALRGVLDGAPSRQDLEARYVGTHHERLDVDHVVSECADQPALSGNAEHLADPRAGDVGIDEQHRHVALARHAEREVDAGERLAIARQCARDQDQVHGRTASECPL